MLHNRSRNTRLTVITFLCLTAYTLFSAMVCDDGYDLIFTADDIEKIDINVCDFDSIGQSHLFSDTTLTYTFEKNKFVLVVDIISQVANKYYPEDKYQTTVSFPIKNIRITSINRFNDDYPAGSIVNAAFGVTDSGLRRLNILWPERGNVNDDTCMIYDFYGSLYFVIRSAPDAGKHQFRVDFILADGKQLSNITPVITLQ